MHPLPISHWRFRRLGCAEAHAVADHVYLRNAAPIRCRNLIPLFSPSFSCRFFRSVSRKISHPTDLGEKFAAQSAVCLEVVRYVA
jgi:hypothetical protein